MASQVLRQLPADDVLHFSTTGFQYKWMYYLGEYETISQVRMQIFQPVLELPSQSPLWQRVLLTGEFSETITLSLHLVSAKTHFSLFSWSHFFNMLPLLVIALVFCFHFLLPKLWTSMWRMHGGIEQQVSRLWNASHPSWRLFSQYLSCELKTHIPLLSPDTLLANVSNRP